MKPDGINTEVRVCAMETEDGEAVDSCPHPQQGLYVTLSQPAKQYDLLRVRKEE